MNNPYFFSVLGAKTNIKLLLFLGLERSQGIIKAGINAFKAIDAIYLEKCIITW